MITQPGLDTPYAATDGPMNVATAISVDGSQLRRLGEQVGGTDGSGGLAADIAHNITTVFNTLSDLELGWAGQTKDEAQEFFDRLDACLTVLYGKDGDQQSEESSVLARVAVALVSAADNYLSAENSVAQMFSVSMDQPMRDGYYAGQAESDQDAAAHAADPHLPYGDTSYANTSSWSGSEIDDPTTTAISELF